MTACAHCDGSVPHEHVDPALASARVIARARSLAWWAGARGPALAAAAAVAVAGTWTSSAGVDALTAPPWFLGLTGALAWLLTTATGLLVAGAAHGPARPRGPRPALALGAVAVGAVTPVLALVLALTLRPGPDAASPWAPSALWIGFGWLAAATAADVAAALRLRGLLLAPDRRGEPERVAAARGPAPREGRQLVGTTAGAVVFTGWLAALGALPALVVVLVPLHAAVAALIARSRSGRRTGTSRTRVPGATIAW